MVHFTRYGLAGIRSNVPSGCCCLDHLSSLGVVVKTSVQAGCNCYVTYVTFTQISTNETHHPPINMTSSINVHNSSGIHSALEFNLHSLCLNGVLIIGLIKTASISIAATRTSCKAVKGLQTDRTVPRCCHALNQLMYRSLHTWISSNRSHMTSSLKWTRVNRGSLEYGQRNLMKEPVISREMRLYARC